ncbi:MAG: GNAT family N-acetyltransferase [Robiginitomaculum sp.]|nr:GNAT family N-acetyltransferase [Robiginitomaculum sp.]
MTHQIKTSNLLLRAFTATDLPKLVELANNIKIAQMFATMPYPYTMDDAQTWLAKLHADNSNYIFAVIHHGEGFIGRIGLYLKPTALPNLGYWIGQPFWGKGYASEAVSALTIWAESQFNIKAIQADFFADNPASGRVLSKAGFLRTGNTGMSYSLGRKTKAHHIDMVWLGETSVGGR